MTILESEFKKTPPPPGKPLKDTYILTLGFPNADFALSRTFFP